MVEGDGSGGDGWAGETEEHECLLSTILEASRPVGLSNLHLLQVDLRRKRQLGGAVETLISASDRGRWPVDGRRQMTGDGWRIADDGGQMTNGRRWAPGYGSPVMCDRLREAGGGLQVTGEGK